MNTTDKYSFILRNLHWIGGVVFVGAFILGQIFDEAKGGTDARQMFFLHASVGLASLGLVAFRLLERFRGPVPASLDSHASWEKKLSKFIQYGLYGVMIALPLSGMLAVWTKGFGVPFFGLFEIPSITGKNDGLHEAFEEIHEALIPMIFPLLGLHIIGALKHHLFDKDQTMSRISPVTRSN